MADTNIVFVKLNKGSTFRTPWGQTIRKGQAVRVASNSPHLDYFRSSSRFTVTETVSTPRTKKARIAARRRSARQVTKAASPAPEENTGLDHLSRKDLVKAARELGLTVRSSDNKPDIMKMITDAKPMLAEKALKDATAANAGEASADNPEEE